MSRRSVAAVAAILLVVLSGCGSGGPSTEELPAKPESVTENSVENFSKNHEVVLKRNQLVDRNNPDSVNVHVTSIEVRKDAPNGYVVSLEIEYRFREGNNAGDGWYEAAYFVNETVVRRDVKEPGSDSELDPRNGTSVEKRISVDGGLTVGS